MLFDNLIKVIDKYNYECADEIDILTDNQSDDIIKKLLEKCKFCKIKSEVDDLDQACIILFIYENPESHDEKTIRFINEYISTKKTIMLIVPLKFDFNYIVKNSNANSIDAISWKDKNGNKFEKYIIVINKD